MAGQRTYPHGVTCWIDSEQPDLEAASRFYGGLFGWTVSVAVLRSADELWTRNALLRDPQGARFTVSQHTRAPRRRVITRARRRPGRGRRPR